MEKQSVFNGGIPTDIDVRMLLEKFPAELFVDGYKLPYSSVEGVLRISRDTCRFATVTRRWRKHIEDYNHVVISGQRGNFVVLDDHEKVTLQHSKLRSAYRSAHKSLKVASKVNTHNLTAQELKAHEHGIRNSAALIATKQLQRKSSLPSLGNAAG